jgi:glycosyltransferase involved in cell wall biosynthesis
MKTGITVLMSVYKSEKPLYLERSLQSIWDDQVYKPEKIILVQDGPLSEDLYAVIDSWKCKLGNMLFIIVNDKNIGLTKSLIKGISEVRTKYIARMDSDDIAMPSRFEEQYNYLEANDNIAIVGCDILEFSDDNPNLGIRHFPRNTPKAIDTIYRANPLAHPAVMMRKQMFDDGINYNSDYRTSQDLALWFDALAAGYKIHNIGKVLLHFRRNDSVYRRRANWNDSILELKIHERGIKKLYGFSPYKSIFPLVRFVLKLLPYSIIKFIYNSSLRKAIIGI